MAAMAKGRSRRFAAAVALALVVGLTQGCGPAWYPVDSRDSGSRAPVPDGYYRVRRGDSLYTIAFGLGLDWRDIAAWNGIRAPYTIYPDQELRLTPPPAAAGPVVVRPAAAPAASVTKGPKEPAPRTAPPTAVASSDPAQWLWPTAGQLLSGFRPDDPSRKGIDIGGKEGQPVIAAAAGEVVYSGSGLIGYGELVIVKHSDRMLSAYAHNRKRLVTEGQKVAAGEQLAEMGRNDRNQVMLHFEIRVNGAPQDPMKFLPRR